MKLLLFWVAVLFGQLSLSNYDDIKNYSTSSYKLAMVLSQYSYISDKNPEDEWREPRETVDLMGGDCEDFALLVDDILSYNGFETSIFVLGSPKTCHAIVWYRKGKDEGIFSNYERFKYRDFNIREYMQENGYTFCREGRDWC